MVTEKTLPDVVGGVRDLGCWQRHPQRYEEPVQMLILS